MTGLGIVCPLGSSIADAWAAILRGESGIGPITRFDVSAFPVRFGGAVRGFDVAQYMSPKEARRMDDFMHYGIAAGMQAVTDAGLDFDKVDRERCGVVTGAGVLGAVVGAFLGGRLTDLLGRKAIYLMDLACFILFTLGSMGAWSLWSLAIFRFLLGVGIGADYPICAA